jgi:hypothetical protein
MNERFRELAKEAGGNPNYKAFGGHFLPPPPDYIDPATVDLAKFAELIVKECAEFVWYKAEKSMSQEVLYVGNDLLKHFGVE